MNFHPAGTVLECENGCKICALSYPVQAGAIIDHWAFCQFRYSQRSNRLDWEKLPLTCNECGGHWLERNLAGAFFFWVDGEKQIFEK